MTRIGASASPAGSFRVSMPWASSSTALEPSADPARSRRSEQPTDVAADHEGRSLGREKAHVTAEHQLPAHVVDEPADLDEGIAVAPAYAGRPADGIHAYLRARLGDPEPQERPDHDGVRQREVEAALRADVPH